MPLLQTLEIEDVITARDSDAQRAQFKRLVIAAASICAAPSTFSLPQRQIGLLARGVRRQTRLASTYGASSRSADGPHLPAASASTEEVISAVGLEP